MYNLVCVRGADLRKAFRKETPATLSAIAALGARRAPARKRNLPPSPYFSLRVDTASETTAWPPGVWQTFVSSWKIANSLHGEIDSEKTAQSVELVSPATESSARLNFL
ncbi:hypothetical protein WN51_02952 [Melipona quadrifasciata]|uniref:Uncharacterized protein n=1 Tax=Melipona quadrifasciata TaxID=166423 RepID=A0A0M9AA97_9HYME|nr:hypothetical protein WN51_02952 [Melipona quadrifasciata]